MVLKREVGKDVHTSRGRNRIVCLSNQHHAERRRLLAPPLFVKARGRKNLEWPAEIEDLNFRKDQNADSMLHRETS